MACMLEILEHAAARAGRHAKRPRPDAARNAPRHRLSRRMFRPAGPRRRPPDDGLPAAAGQRVARGLECAELHLAGGLDLQQRSPCGQSACGPGVFGDGVQRPGELRAAGGDARLPPVAVAGDQRVVEGVRPVLQLEVGAVGSGAPRRVDPRAGRPAGARAHSDVCSVPSESTAKPGIPRLSTATVRASKGSRSDGASCSTTISASARSSTTDGDRGVAAVPGDHQHRQRAHAAQIRSRYPFVGQRRVATAPTPAPRRWRTAGASVPRCRRGRPRPAPLR